MSCSSRDTLTRNNHRPNWIITTALIAGFAVTMNFYALNLLAPEINHWCKQPEDMRNYTSEQWKEIAIPKQNGKYSSCLVFQQPTSSGPNRSVINCSLWDFDPNVNVRTLTNDHHLVCGRRKMTATSRAAYFVSGLCTTPLWGHLIDAFGRRNLLITATAGTLFSTIAMIFSWSFEAFLTFRTAQAAALSLLRVVSVVALFDLSTTKTRDRNVCICHYGESFARLVLAFLTGSIIDKNVIYILLMVPASSLLYNLFTARESGKWLAATHPWLCGAVLWVNKAGILF
ncbi:solute carrier family 22 member 6-like [Ornithodoros turicata]|uniref:solute carrier family 22 member 6-like n=1 Tax=Ornithodoros turicata TaxID=34597 RepID=UPI0031398E22